VLEQQAPEEGAGAVLVLLEDHEVVEVEAGGHVGPELDADGLVAAGQRHEARLLLDGGDLHGDPL
jgi:hypothetical protein